MRTASTIQLALTCVLAIALSLCIGCAKPKEVETPAVDVTPVVEDVPEGAAEDEPAEGTPGETPEEEVDEPSAAGDDGETEAAAADQPQEAWVTAEGGLRYKDVKVGDGAEAVDGKRVSVLYTGKLTDGTVFDASDRHGNDPYAFVLGTGNAIEGWHIGIKGMKVGGKRTLEIPSDLGYGDRGSPPDISGGATLIFDCELTAVD